MTKLFLVGRNKQPEATDPNWDFQGIFSTEALALAACRDSTYFIGPVTLDQELPHETASEWPDCRYPIQREAV